MKKIVLAVSSALVAGAMLFAFAGCGDKTPADNDVSGADVSNVVEAEVSSIA